MDEYANVEPRQVLMTLDIETKRFQKAYLHNPDDVLHALDEFEITNVIPTIMFLRMFNDIVRLRLGDFNGE